MRAGLCAKGRSQPCAAKVSAKRHQVISYILLQDHNPLVTGLPFSNFKPENERCRKSLADNHAARMNHSSLTAELS